MKKFELILKSLFDCDTIKICVYELGSYIRTKMRREENKKGKWAGGESPWAYGKDVREAMHHLMGASNWRLMIRREQEGIVLLRAVTCDQKAELPAWLFGLPVMALGRRALSPIAGPETGEEEWITCGLAKAEADWDNKNLRELTLPETLHQIGDFAFSNCGNLEALHLRGDIQSWGSDALYNCRALHQICIASQGNPGTALAYFADAVNGELDVTMEGACRGKIRLIFPAFEESYEEDFIAQAVHFDYQINGAGYPYHNCFQGNRLCLRDYDALWKGYLGMNCDTKTAIRLAFWRLRYPVELSYSARVDYEDYLAAHVGMAIGWLLEEGDASELRMLLHWTEPDRETLAMACGQARQKRMTEALALLLEEQHRRYAWQERERFLL